MASLAEIRARLQAQEPKAAGTTQFSGDNVVYPHWNIAEGSSATIRFLPDHDDARNPFFWVERAMIRLPFNGIKGDVNSRQVAVQVPCIDMYEPNGKSVCPVLAEVRPWYKDDSLKDLANKYWKKRSYLFQGFVRENPLADDKAPENPIRRFMISPQIYSIVKASLLDPDMENLPTDYLAGLDFRINKTKKGEYADYSTSNWARRESALTEAEQAAIAQYGLFNLADSLPKKPTDVELKVIMEMFEASVDGQPYDADRWGQYYRPAGVSAPAGGSQPAQAPAPAAQAPAPAPVAEDVPFEPDAPVVASAPVQTPAAQPAASSSNTQDILAMIRARQNKQ